MVSVFKILNSRLPVLKFFEEKFTQKYGINNITGPWNETYYVYIFVASLIHASLLIYGFYLLYTCLKVKKQQGSGTTFVNGLCDVMFACLCMPCYIIYRGFINPCKVLEEVKIVKEYYGVPTQQPVMAQQPVVTQQPATTMMTPTGPITTTGPIGKTTINKVSGGGKKPKKKVVKSKKNVVKSNKILL